MKTISHILICLDSQTTIDLDEDTCEECDAALPSAVRAMNEQKEGTTDDDPQPEMLWTPQWDEEAHRPSSLG